MNLKETIPMMEFQMEIIKIKNIAETENFRDSTQKETKKEEHKKMKLKKGKT